MNKPIAQAQMYAICWFLFYRTYRIVLYCIVLYGARICDNNIQQIDEIFSSPESSFFLFLLPSFDQKLLVTFIS